MTKNRLKPPASRPLILLFVAISISFILAGYLFQEEISASHRSKALMTAIILILSIITAGLFLGIIIWHRRVRFYRGMYEYEIDKQAFIKHFDYILKYANDNILLFDDNLKIVEVNDSALRTYMYDREEFIGMNLEMILAPEARLRVQDRLRLLNHEESATFESLHIRKDGSVFPMEVSIRTVNIEGAEFYQTIGRNITDRKQAENTLRESEEKFRKLFEESPFGTVMTDRELRIIKSNNSFCKMIGYSQEELKSFTFKDFTRPDQINVDEESVAKLIIGEIPIYHTEKPYIRKDGRTIWGSTTISTIRKNDGEIQFFFAMVEDITFRKEAESGLERSLSLLSTTVESTADGILVVDLKGKIVLYNKKFAEMWRIPKNLLDTGEDKKLLVFVKDQMMNPEKFLNEVQDIYSDPDQVDFETLKFIDGRCFERYSQPQVINGKSVGRVWSFHDITKMKRAEAEMIAAKEKAEESDKLKTAFLHNVSHEIRTPMNAIIGFSTLLNDPIISEEERNQYSGIIAQSSDQLLSIINDIVDIANIESGQVKINIGEMNLNESLKNLRRQFSYASNVEINLLIDVPDEEANIKTDGTKILQILSNLISNALKFTGEGKVDFGYIKRKGSIEFFVDDTGIGIPREHLGKIFRRFYQVDAQGTRQFGGTGLGLSICKAYVELLGGDIRVESEPGKGTRFSFDVPYGSSS